MSEDETAAAFGVRLDDLRGWDRIGYRVEEVGVKLYFDADVRLASVASDMRSGPQVRRFLRQDYRAPGRHHEHGRLSGAFPPVGGEGGPELVGPALVAMSFA